MRGLALTKYGSSAASTRQRFLQYNRYFELEEIALDYNHLFDDYYLEILYKTNNRSLFNIIKSYIKRILLLIRNNEYQFFIIHCESFPYLPGFAEFIPFIWQRPIIYDFDDAIFHQYDRHPNWLVRKLLGRKLEPLLRGADLAICGNAYLEAYAARFCRRTGIVPTVVDTDVFKPRPQGEVTPADATRRPVVGWIGSPSTFAYVRPLVPLLSSLAQDLDLDIRIVGAGPQADIPPRFSFIDWSEPEEIALIQGMDIGIMPLPDEPWARGKCGYKLIQYMACGLPVIASPVGVNADIVEHGVNGFLATTPEEWTAAIRTLAADPALRARMGAAGRAKIEREYSLAVHGPRLARMIRETVEAAKA